MEINRDKLREFLLFIRDKTKVTSPELIEKDFYLIATDLNNSSDCQLVYSGEQKTMGEYFSLSL